MASDNDALSIKNILFSKPIPNLVLPPEAAGHKVYPCIDCGDSFVFESNYDYHVSRKSMKISYKCRQCNQVKIFNNRCNFLSHIRSHGLKTVTIHVNDLKLEPLPFKEFLELTSSVHRKVSEQTLLQGYLSEDPHQNSNKYCLECKTPLTETGANNNRANHFLRMTGERYTCPVCTFISPTTCGLKVHLRVHLNKSPLFCPECGCLLDNISIYYPYTHNCQGFNLMRSYSRCKCPVNNCKILPPTVLVKHFNNMHLKKVFKCPLCNVASFSEETTKKHIKVHKGTAKFILYYKCEMCPGRLVLQSQIDNHVMIHCNKYVYPCLECNEVCLDIEKLLYHFIYAHNVSDIMKNLLKETMVPEYSQALENPSLTLVQNEKPQEFLSNVLIMSRAQSLLKEIRNKTKPYTIGSQSDHILNTSNKNGKVIDISEPIVESENNLNLTAERTSTISEKSVETVVIDKNSTVSQESLETVNNAANLITCHLCDIKITQNWKNIKEHYVADHREIRWVDPQINVIRLDIQKYKAESRKNKIISNKRSRKDKSRVRVKVLNNRNDNQNNLLPSSISHNSVIFCRKCGEKTANKEILEAHFISHRDPYMAYQCVECGECFAVKSSFAIHLLTEHDISDVDTYISIKKCYSESALEHQDLPTEEPLDENQCSICRQKFDNEYDYERHFRSHGLAFLRKNFENRKR